MNYQFKLPNIINKEASERSPVDQGPPTGPFTDQNGRTVHHKRNQLQIQSSSYKRQHLCSKKVEFRSLQEENVNQQLQMKRMSEGICENDLNFNDFPNESDTLPNKSPQYQSITHQYTNYHESMSSVPHKMTEFGPLKPQRHRSDAKPPYNKMASIGEVEEVESPLPKCIQFSSIQKGPSKFMNKDHRVKFIFEKIQLTFFSVKFKKDQIRFFHQRR